MKTLIFDMARSSSMRAHNKLDVISVSPNIWPGLFKSQEVTFPQEGGMRVFGIEIQVDSNLPDNAISLKYMKEIV